MPLCIKDFCRIQITDWFEPIFSSTVTMNIGYNELNYYCPDTNSRCFVFKQSNQPYKYHAIFGWLGRAACPIVTSITNLTLDLLRWKTCAYHPKASTWKISGEKISFLNNCTSWNQNRTVLQWHKKKIDGWTSKYGWLGFQINVWTFKYRWLGFQIKTECCNKPDTRNCLFLDVLFFQSLHCIIFLLF